MAHRYLVTGCAGFIGASICRRLLDQGDEVLGIDNLNAAYDPRLKEWRLAQLNTSDAFRFTRLDVVDRLALRDWFRERGPFTAVVHLAAWAGVRASVENPWIYLETNLGGTLNLLDCCREFGVGKFVLASTSSVYGDQTPAPFREDADTSRSLSPYAASKIGAERFAYSYHALHGLDVSVVRYFTVYGPAGRPDMSVFRFTRRIAEGEPITVHGDGQQRRDFTYIDDIARGTVAALAPLGYATINLGGDRPTPLSKVIELIESRLGRKAEIRVLPAHAADVSATWADISLAKSLLDWSPSVKLEEGLARTVEWYWRHRDALLPIRLGDGFDTSS